MKRPSAPERVSATMVVPRQIVMRASYGRSGHGLSMRSTGHVGPIVTTPAMPVSPEGGVDVGAGRVGVFVAAAVAGDGVEEAIAVPVGGVRLTGGVVVDVAARSGVGPHAPSAIVPAAIAATIRWWERRRIMAKA